MVKRNLFCVLNFAINNPQGGEFLCGVTLVKQILFGGNEFLLRKNHTFGWLDSTKDFLLQVPCPVVKKKKKSVLYKLSILTVYNRIYNNNIFLFMPLKHIV